MARVNASSPITQDVNEAAVGLAPLTAADVAAQTDDGSFKRGRAYARTGHIFNAVRREQTLRARCHGSSGGPYLVEATLAQAAAPRARNPMAYSCNCPRGGFCKHIVALLLTWIETPESCTVRPPVKEVLADRSQEELIVLIELMLREAPDLEEMLDLPVPVPGSATDTAVDELAIRRQVATAMREMDNYGDRYDYYDYDWEVSSTPAKLQRLVDLADSYLDADQLRHALMVSATFVEELAPHLEFLGEQEGDLCGLVGRSDDVLAAILDAQPDLSNEERLAAGERTRLIDAIVLIWQTNIDIGGVAMSNEGPEAIARAASGDEQRRVGEHLRQLIRPESDNRWHDRWQAQAAIRFLALLSGDAGLSDEELLTEYRNAELWFEAAKLLLRIERIDEAIRIASRHVTAVTDLTSLADHLLTSGDTKRVEQAIALIDDRLWEREGQDARDDELLRTWLEKQYAVHNMPEKALKMAQSRFKVRPSRSTYEAVKTTALLPGQAEDVWPALRPTLIATLRKRGDWYELIDIHLAEGEIAEAIEALKKSEQPRKMNQIGWGYYGYYGLVASPETYPVRVAAAAEADFPEEAIRIYQQMAEKCIDARGRSNYQAAATYLVRVRHILETSGRTGEWHLLIADLRLRNKSLRALREELDALGLN